MRSDRAHLAANAGCGLALLALALASIWGWLPVGWPLRLLASLGALVLLSLATHRLLPRLTGPLLGRRGRERDDR